ncbi:hypothetical protein FOIG_09618 [Fusarium odoratissimum NRRL 54006]|uniref:Uncharacterized protein n=1 Tax=Fusarium odoratissimum (strain NRRL 54006) TaxID=1089451 RepID=X0KMJ0_FUSO5|nr:uncharacterized protein FOIG_09618 [Fusarium odoratissimum NRRL 54006]EXL98059.1 hypothetical protein FOIG_09618 [Fusarium odoratissimum NRRL 54006]RKK38520.1 hypothetical protein BFJ66_g12461 [Fusarium oxysporum f. sp. cepae]
MPSRPPTDNAMPGTRCPKCSTPENDVWVIPGRNCGHCGTYCE